ncbi:hypothetical protein JXA02_14160 [candidate division KSB1 bacterium]|nr:hypothetical protein [candidate division KSB1 bacterium]RQW01751.1 MAG: hypothetical protein EH222_14610 [candidate division KSB1 bacterium]
MSLISDVRSGLARLDHSRRGLKKFGLTMAIMLGLLATLLFIFSSRPQRAWWLAGIAVLLLGLALSYPSSLNPLHRLWMGLALVLGYFMSRILLTILFYFIITPIGLIMRLAGKDILNERIEPDRQSYWIVRPKTETSPDRYEKLF